MADDAPTSEQRNLPHCPQCGYDFAGLPRQHHCPECGFEFDDDCMLMVRGRSRLSLPGAPVLVPIAQSLSWGLIVLADNVVLALLACMIIVLSIAAVVGYRMVQKRRGIERQMLATPDGVTVRALPADFSLRSWKEISHLQFARHYRWTFSRTKPSPREYRFAFLDRPSLLPGGQTTHIPDAPSPARNIFHVPIEFFVEADDDEARRIHEFVRELWLDAHGLTIDDVDVSKTKLRRVRD